MLNWTKVAEAGWFSVPKLMPVTLVFDLRVIISRCHHVCRNGQLKRWAIRRPLRKAGSDGEATDKELSSAVICDGVGSGGSGLWCASEYILQPECVGLVGMTKVVNLFGISTGAVFLILCGLFPKDCRTDLNYAPVGSRRALRL